MRLERSTYVKIALIVLLCLGVCGFFGGCRGIVPGGGSLFAPGGLMGCVGWNAMGEIAGYAGDAVGEMADYAAMPRVRWRMRRCTVACGAASQRRTRAAISKSMPAR